MSNDRTTIHVDDWIAIGDTMQNDKLPNAAYHPTTDEFTATENNAEVDVTETDKNTFLLPVTELSRLIRAKYVSTGLATTTNDAAQEEYVKQLIDYKADELSELLETTKSELILPYEEERGTQDSPLYSSDGNTETPTVDREISLLQDEFNQKITDKVTSLEGTLLFETRENILAVQEISEKIRKQGKVEATTVLHPSIPSNTFAITLPAIERLTTADIHGGTLQRADKQDGVGQFKPKKEVLDELQSELKRIGGEMIHLTENGVTINTETTTIDYIIYGENEIDSMREFRRKYPIQNQNGDVISMDVTDSAGGIPGRVFNNMLRLYNDDSKTTVFASELAGVRPHEMGYGYPLKILAWYGDGSNSGSKYAFVPWYGSVTCTCERRQQEQKYTYPVCEHEIQAMILKHNDKLVRDADDVPPRYKRFVPKREYNMFREEFK